MCGQRRSFSCSCNSQVLLRLFHNKQLEKKTSAAEAVQNAKSSSAISEGMTHVGKYQGAWTFPTPFAVLYPQKHPVGHGEDIGDEGRGRALPEALQSALKPQNNDVYLCYDY